MTHEQETKDTSAAPSHPTDAQGKPAAPGGQGKPRQHDKVARMGTESIPRLITEFAIPAILGMLVNGAYNVIDSIFLGQAMGEIGLSAATVANAHHDGVHGYRHAGWQRRQRLGCAAPGRGQARGGRASAWATRSRLRLVSPRSAVAMRHDRPACIGRAAQRFRAPLRRRAALCACSSSADHQPGLHLPVHRHGREQLHPHRRRARTARWAP